MVFNLCTSSEDEGSNDISDRGRRRDNNSDRHGANSSMRTSGVSEDHSSDNISDRSSGRDNNSGLGGLDYIMRTYSLSSTSEDDSSHSNSDLGGLNDLKRPLNLSSTSEDASSDNNSDRGGGRDNILNRGRRDNILRIGGLGPVMLLGRARKENFRQNGGELLKHQRVQIFTEGKLAKATNNYNHNNKLRDDLFSSVHVGTIARDTVVVVKKPKDMDNSKRNRDLERELKILMNISHKNVVKLKGICLTTKIPLLVYEYIPNGTLFQLIHQNERTISWEDCFKIAAEAALALNYMHSNIKPSIVHGNINSANILLDRNNLVKISDFGTSVLISLHHRSMVAQNSLGYMDPEYPITGMLTTQSDVYSFGVVLVELLTRKKLCVTKINTIDHFVSSVKGDMLSDVINLEGISEDDVERVACIARIAVQCLNQSGANRPEMSEVAQMLASINPSSTIEEDDKEVNEETFEEYDEEASINPSSTIEEYDEGGRTLCGCLIP